MDSKSPRSCSIYKLLFIRKHNCLDFGASLDLTFEMDLEKNLDMLEEPSSDHRGNQDRVAGNRRPWDTQYDSLSELQEPQRQTWLEKNFHPNK